MMYDTLESSFGVCCVVTHHSLHQWVLHGFLHRKTDLKMDRSKALHGSESEIPRSCRAAQRPWGAVQRVTTPTLHTHLWKGQTGVTKRRQSKMEEKIMKASEKGKRLKERADKVCWVLPVYPLIHSLLITLALCWEAHSHRGHLCSDFWLGLA